MYSFKEPILVTLKIERRLSRCWIGVWGGGGGGGEWGEGAYTASQTTVPWRDLIKQIIRLSSFVFFLFFFFQHLPRDMANVNVWKTMFDPYNDAHVAFEPQSEKTYLRTYAPGRLIRIFTERILNYQRRKVSSCVKQKIWSDCGYARVIWVFVGRSSP